MRTTGVRRPEGVIKKKERKRSCVKEVGTALESACAFSQFLFDMYTAELPFASRQYNSLNITSSERR